jgi:hypothetical protein
MCDKQFVSIGSTAVSSCTLACCCAQVKRCVNSDTQRQQLHQQQQQRRALRALLYTVESDTYFVVEEYEVHCTAMIALKSAVERPLFICSYTMLQFVQVGVLSSAPPTMNSSMHTRSTHTQYT